MHAIPLTLLVPSLFHHSETDLDESVIDVVEVAEEELPDIDRECADDPFQSPVYAYDIFQYYKVREKRTGLL